MMKPVRFTLFLKFLGSALFFLGLTGFAWVGLLAFSAHSTEVNIKKRFASEVAINSEATKRNTFSLELVHYKRALLKSYAQFRLRSTDPELDSLLAESLLLMKIKHGPVLVSDKGLSFGVALMTVVLEEQPDLLELTMMVGFDHVLHYDMSVAAIEYKEDDFSFSSTKGIGKGIVDLGLLTNSLALEMGRISFNLGRQSVTTVGNKLMFSLDNSVDAVSLVEYEPQASSSLLQGLQIPALVKTVLAYQEWEDIHRQIEWTLEFSGEYQEGRDKLLALYDRLDQLVMKDNLQTILMDEAALVE